MSYAGILRERRIIVVFGVVAGLALLLIIVALCLHPDPRLEAIRKQGYPVTLAEADAYYAPVPNVKNPALVYERLFSLPAFRGVNGLQQQFSDDSKWLPPVGEVLSAAQREELAALLEPNQETIGLLYSAPNSGRCRYSLDFKLGPALPLPHLAAIKSSVCLLCAQSMLHAANAAPDRAVQALLAAGRVADSVADEPILWSHLTQERGWGIIVARLERLLSTAPLSEEQLLRLDHALEQAEKPKALARALAGQRACGLSVFIDREALCWLLYNQPEGNLSGAERLRLLGFLALTKTSGVFAKDKACFLNSFAAMIEAAQLSFPERWKLGEHATTNLLVSRHYLLSMTALLKTSGAFTQNADHAARLRAARVALAIERFRRANRGGPPASLQDLVPGYLPSIPLDPYDGRPLRLARLASGYVVYSIGKDLQDDGGLPENTKTGAPSHDLTFTVVR